MISRNRIYPEEMASIIFEEVFRNRISEKFVSRYFPGTGNEDNSWFFIFEYGLNSSFVIEFDYVDLFFYITPQNVEDKNGEELYQYLSENEIHCIFKMVAINKDTVKEFFEKYFKGFIS